MAAIVRLAGALPTGKLVQPQSLTRWKRRSMKGLRPDSLASILTNAEQGDLEDWADLAAYMLRDPHVRAVYETRTLAITGAELVVEPAADDDPLAEAGAEFIRQDFDATEDFEEVLGGLIHAEGIGYAVAVHNFTRQRGGWHSDPYMIEPRDVGFDSDWQVKVRTYTDAARSAGQWRTVGEELPRQSFICHIPRKLDRPTVAGDLMACAWAWLFKRWMERFRQEGMEKFASPFIVGKIPPNAPDAVRDALKDALENLSADQIAVLEDGSSIEYQEAAQRPGDAWSDAIAAWNREITKALLGSDLNTEVGSTGGNRALGDRQFRTTILPRWRSISRRVCGTIERDWAAQLLRLNAHLFNGQVPPTPRIRLLVDDEPPEIPTEAVVAGMKVTQNEWRQSLGLAALSTEQGGETFIAPPAPEVRQDLGGMGVPSAAAAHEVAAPVPFARQGSLPFTSARRRTSPTSSASRTRSARAPFDS